MAFARGKDHCEECDGGDECEDFLHNFFVLLSVFDFDKNEMQSSYQILNLKANVVFSCK